MWFVIVISTTLATQDIYPGGNSREECEQIVEKARASNPQPLQPGIRVECVASSQVESWFKTNYSFGTAPEQ
jgi:hypothetical protein